MIRVTQASLEDLLPSIRRMTAQLISELNETIDRTLGALIPERTPVALVGFPNHSNVGDSAIWLGERAWLARRSADVRYACDDVSSYSARDLDRRLGDGGTVLLHGGGNFGDVWPEHQRFRERVVLDHRHRPIVQLPQSLQFGSGEAMRASADVLSQAAELVVLCRDRPSRDVAAQLGLEGRLCPDLAFALGALTPADGPVRDLVWLGRTDSERSRPGADDPDIEMADWLDERGVGRGVLTYERLRSASLHYGRLRVTRPRLAALDRRLLPLAYDALARRRLDYGLRMLSAGRVVVTDRLHGHILSLLLGKRHVLFDSGYGKLSRFHDVWTRPALADGVLRIADAPGDALATAREWLAQDEDR